MKRYILFSILALSVLSSCTEKFAPEEEKYVQFSVRVSLDTTDISTKTSMTDDVENQIGKVKWSSGDFLTLYNETSYYIKGIHSKNATNISEDGVSATFYFDVIKQDAEYIAKYNNFLFYGDTTAISVTAGKYGCEFSVSLPANQTHAGAACFQEFENISFGCCPTGSFEYNSELGEFPGTAECTMHNAFGILKVPITGAFDPNSIRYVRLTDRTSGQYLAGTFDVSISNDGIPTLTHKVGTGGESRTIEKAITKATPITSDNTGKYVYFLVPPGTLFGTDGFNIAVYTDAGWYSSKNIKNKNGVTANSIERSKITQLDLSPFIRYDYVVLPEQPSANSFIFNSNAGLASFPAHYKGNGFQGNGGNIEARSNEISYSSAYYPEIIWQTKNNGETLIAAEIIDSPVYFLNGSYPCIGFHKSGVPGNALIALRNPNKKVWAKQLDGSTKQVDEILWSWHVWITEDGEYAKINNGVMLTNQDNGQNVITIMDRNLGALYADPTISEQATQTHGLAYQFGRKDPYMGSRYTLTDANTALEYKSFASIYPPTAIYCVSQSDASDFSIDNSILFPYQRSLRSNGDWCNSLVSWGDLEKGNISIVTYKNLYDPCPLGWRTFEEKYIVAALGRDENNNIKTPIGSVVASGSGYAFKFSNNNVPIYFPAAGYSNETTAVTVVGSVMALWGSNYGSIISDQSQHTQANYLHITLKSIGNEYNTAYTSEVKSMDMKATMPVRCQKWTEPTDVPHGNTPTYIEDSEEIVL